MEPAELQRAVASGRSVATSLGLHVDDAVVLHNSNRIALRLTPCDVLARVTPVSHQAGAEFEVAVARHLAQADGPVAGLEPRVAPLVYARDGFAVTLWTYFEAGPSSDITPANYAQALARLHAGLRQIDLRAPHFTDRVAEAQRLVADHDETPELLDADRGLLSNALAVLSTEISGRGADDQLLHGEPHQGNVLSTRNGLLFIDLETCCRGPVEFDIAHGLFRGEAPTLAANEVSEHYPGANEAVVEQCRILIWAMITTWRWDRTDQLPDGHYWRTEGLNQLRLALDRPAD